MTDTVHPSGIIAHGDGSFTVPAGFTGLLPEVPAEWYGPDSVPLEPLTPDTPPDTDPDEDLTEDDSGAVETTTTTETTTTETTTEEPDDA